MAPTVYLGGQIQHLPDDGSHWRREATKLLRDRGYEVINPLTDIDADEGSINVVGKDLQALRDTDVFLARWSLVPSAGTPMEIAYCDRWNIPVVIVADCVFDDISPWVQYHAKDIVDTIGDGVECVELFAPTKIV